MMTDKAPEKTLTPNDITVKKYYSIYDLAELDSVKRYGGWQQTPNKVKLSVLWELGLDVYRWGFFSVLCNHRRQNSTKTITGLQIYSQERSDDEWLHKRIDGRRVASLEAQLMAKGDDSLSHELRQMGRGGVRG